MTPLSPTEQASSSTNVAVASGEVKKPKESKKRRVTKKVKEMMRLKTKATNISNGTHAWFRAVTFFILSAFQNQTVVFCQVLVPLA